MRKPITQNPSKARELLLDQMQRNGERWNRLGDDQLEILREREQLEELWRLAGWGDPPPFTPTMPLAYRRVS